MNKLYYAMLGLFILAVIGGCSMGQQDPRIVLCLNLANTLAEGDANNTWQKTDVNIVRPEYAAISVSDGKQQAVCYYEYDAVEESALDHVDELEAYATLPYQMTLNGQKVEKKRLTTAVNNEQTKVVRGLLDSISRWLGIKAS